jgi:hypothetical protein
MSDRRMPKKLLESSCERRTIARIHLVLLKKCPISIGVISFRCDLRAMRITFLG